MGSFEKFENNFEQTKISQEELESLIGAQIAEIRDYYGEGADDWINNFKERLGKIETLANSDEAVEFYGKSVQESVSLRTRTIMENLDNLNPDMLSKEVKESLIKGLDNLFN